MDSTKQPREEALQKYGRLVRRQDLQDINGIPLRQFMGLTELRLLDYGLDNMAYHPQLAALISNNSSILRVFEIEHPCGLTTKDALNAFFSCSRLMQLKMQSRYYRMTSSRQFVATFSQLRCFDSCEGIFYSADQRHGLFS